MHLPPVRTEDEHEHAWLRAAWARFVPYRAIPSPERQKAAAELIDAIVPRGREEAAVVWLLATRLMPAPTPPFSSDDWIGIGCREVYAEFEGRGYGDRRVLQLLERWARWCHARGEITRPVLGDLLGDLDRARVATGHAPRRVLQPRPFGGDPEHLLRGFDADPDVRTQACLAMHSVLAFLDEAQGRPGRLHAFDAGAYVVDLWASLRPAEELGARERRQVTQAAATLFAQIGAIFSFLDGSAHLLAGQGEVLATQMRHAAMGVRMAPEDRPVH